MSQEDRPKREFFRVGKRAAVEANDRDRYTTAGFLLRSRKLPHIVVGKTLEEYEAMTPEEDAKAIYLVRSDGLKIKIFSNDIPAHGLDSDVMDEYGQV